MNRWRKQPRLQCNRCGGELRLALTNASFYPPDAKLNLMKDGDALLGYSIAIECQKCHNTPTSMGGLTDLHPYGGDNPFIAYQTERP